jgi:DNA-binding PadR family transcriptional regulator
VLKPRWPRGEEVGGILSETAQLRPAPMMRSAREFIIEALSSHGPLHGYGIHDLSLSASRERDEHLSASAIYGALRRMERRGEVVIARIERRGNFPPQTIYRLGHPADES